MRSQVKKHYELLSEVQLLNECRHLEFEQAEAAKLLKASAIDKDLYTEYKELYPGIRGDIGVEEAHSESVIGAVAMAVKEKLKRDAAQARKQLALQPIPTSPQPAVIESPVIDQIFRDATTVEISCIYCLLSHIFISYQSYIFTH